MNKLRLGLLLGFCSASALGWAGAAEAAADPSASSDLPNNVREVVVTAPRKDSTARLVQEQAANIVNVQAADTIAKYPDFNAAEALGRMPGVSLSIDTGEGRFVTIRGIDSNLDGATFGGVVLLNSYPNGTYFSGTGRAVEFDTVPVGAVDRIEVTKTGLPDHEAEGIGGSIELSPRSARSITKPFADVEVSGGYENLRDSFAPINEQVVVGSRFGFGDHGLTVGEGPFSFVLTQFQHNDRRAVDDFEEAYGVDNGFTGPDKVYDSAEFRRYNYFRRRFGYSGEFDFDPNANHHYFVRANIAGYTENVHRQRLIYGNLEFDAAGNSLVPAGAPCPTGDTGPCSYTDPQNPNGYYAPAASAQVTLRDQQETHRNTLYAAGGSDRFGQVLVDYELAYTQATYHKPFDLNWTFNNPNSYGIAFDNSNSNFPKFTVESGGNILNPALYQLSSLQNSQEYDTDEEWSFQTNASFPLHLLSDGELKFGGKVRLRKKVVDPTNQSYDFSGTQTLADLKGGGPFTYYQGLYNIGYEPNGDALKQLLATSPGLFLGHYSLNGAVTAENALRDLSGYYRDNENVYAGYAQYTTHVGALSILAGVRVEGTDAVYRGYVTTARTTPCATLSASCIEVGSSYDDVALGANNSSYVNAFPTVQLRYEFAPKLIGRLTYSTGVARPGFSQISATTSVDVGGGTVSTGNPNLQPTYSNNLDAALEWYLPGSGILALGLFDKEMDNYIVTRSVTASSYEGVNQLWHIATYENAPAYARGAEFQYVQKFFWAPEGLRDFGVDTNVTYVDSQVELFSGVKALLPGTARWTGNAAVFYEAHGLNLRLAGEYVGKNLFTVGGDQTTNNYEDKRFQVDFTSSYQLCPQLQLFFNAKNLNNEPLRFFEGRADRPLQREFYDQTYELGLRAHF